MANNDATTLSITPERRAALGRRARLLAWVTLGYNALEAIAAVTAGIVASSVALISFGGDSIVECLSALVILWQFRGIAQERERQALRLIAVSFFVLAAYVSVDALRSLIDGADPKPSPVGIGLAALSLLVMPFLSWAKRRTGAELGSPTVVADSVQTLLCTYLSAVLLVGLLANSLVGWGWADPIAALIVAAVALREGVEAWRGQGCDC
ncbi:MAG: cation transporter [Actinomycetia bacterium]|nr:cation transporter [Actinomycetes bacterium]